MAPGQVALEPVAAERLAAGRLAAGRLVAGRLVAERLVPEQVPSAVLRAGPSSFRRSHRHQRFRSGTCARGQRYHATMQVRASSSRQPAVSGFCPSFPLAQRGAPELRDLEGAVAGCRSGYAHDIVDPPAVRQGVRDLAGVEDIFRIRTARECSSSARRPNVREQHRTAGSSDALLFVMRLHRSVAAAGTS